MNKSLSMEEGNNTKGNDYIRYGKDNSGITVDAQYNLLKFEVVKN